MIIVLFSVLLYGKSIKLHGDWWNTEPTVCAKCRPIDAGEEKKYDSLSQTHPTIEEEVQQVVT